MKPGKNDPCPCASGKKFKKCCAQKPLDNALAESGKSDKSAAQADHQHRQLNANDMSALIALFNDRHYAELETQAHTLIAQYPHSGFVWKVLGVALKAQGKDALIALQKAAELSPNDAEAHSNLAFALQDLGQLDAAVNSCRRALQIEPRNVVAHHNLGGILRELRQLDAAALSCRQALAIKPTYAEAHNNLGMVLRLQGHGHEAEISCRKALEINPNLLVAIIFMAELQADKGQFIEAEAMFRRAIAIDSESPEAWAGIARLRKMTKNDKDWLTATETLSERDLTPRAESRLRYALGKFYDDTGDFEQAFHNYRRANDLGRQYGIPYDRAQQTLAVDALTQVYGSAWIENQQRYANRSACPVFIVGMPRSGTSLAEQILASHPAVYGAGELGFWKHTTAMHASSVLTGNIDQRALRKFSDDYLQLLQRFSSDALRIVDKMPDNFLYLGLIHAAFPNARIIHMQRHPVDTCLSIYFQHFNGSHTYSHDLEDLAHYYTEYFRIMQHWNAILPASAILHVPYEGLVGNQEGWSRKMLDFIGLPWDARCIDFHQCVRTVSTASNWQVRQKMNQSSVLRWLNYEKFSGPLRKLLELGDPTGTTEHDGEALAVFMLGNLLRRAEASLRTEQEHDVLTSSVSDTTSFRARETAERLLTTG